MRTLVDLVSEVKSQYSHSVIIPLMSMCDYMTAHDLLYLNSEFTPRKEIINQNGTKKTMLVLAGGRKNQK